MKSNRLQVLILILGFLLAACSGNAAEERTAASSQPADNPALNTNARRGSVLSGEIFQAEERPSDAVQLKWPDGEIQLDDQGAVEVAVTPLNLNAPDGSLNFNVGLNTHSVDLSMDLALLATLETDRGLGVQAISWEAPRGGHHVSGVLSFPTTSDGKPLLEGASRLILRIQDMDAPQREFTWNLGS